MPQVHEVELRIIELPLRGSFNAAHGSMATKRAVVVRIGTDQGDGWGECGALSLPSYTHEYVDGVWLLLHDIVGPALLRGTPPPVVGHPMAMAAVEAALVDAELRATGATLAGRVGAVRNRVMVGVAVGLQESTDALVESVANQVEAGYRRVKVKVTPADDHQSLAALRSSFPDLDLWADANGSYVGMPPERVAELDKYNLGLIEQPFGASQFHAHARLREVSSTPVCLDESIESADHLDLAIAANAVDIVNVKPARVGGYGETLRIHQRCIDDGLGLWLGGMLETGIGRAANLALAGLPGMTHSGDLSASDRYFEADLVTNPAVLRSDGTIDVPDRAEIDDRAVADKTTKVATLTR